MLFLWLFIKAVTSLSHCTATHDALPHIVFVLADDLGWADTSIHGATQIPTPNIDSLASMGVVLNNYYVQPLCTPSRASLMTGLYATHSGLNSEALQPSQVGGLPLTLKILPEYLKDLGYETHIVGKWHLGYSSYNYTPTFRGFDSFFGMYTGIEDYYSHFTQWDGQRGLDFWRDKDPLWRESGNYSTTLYAEQAKFVISNRNTSKPLFLYLAHQAPHGGNEPLLLQAPEEYVEKFLYIGDENRTIYAGMVDAMDESVGVLLEALETADMLKDTVLVFNSDNGGSPYGHSGTRGFNWPLRGTKGALWEGGVRSTAFIWSPRLSSNGRVSDQLMHISDWLPTLYSAAGGDIQALGVIDGLDMWQALSSGDGSPRTELLHEIDDWSGVSGLRYGPYKLVVGSYGGLYDDRYEVVGESLTYGQVQKLQRQSKAAAVLERFYGNPDLFENRGADLRKKATVRCPERNGSGNFIAGQRYYLFDLDSDPCELRNLADELQPVLHTLLDKLRAYNETALPRMSVQYDPKSYPENHNGVWAPWILN